MQEVPLDRCPEVLAFGEALAAGRVDGIVFLTGVGAEALLARLEPVYGRDETIARIDTLTTLVRGPKPKAVLRKWGVHIDVLAPAPNTWEDLVRTLDESPHSVEGRHVAVQEYGTANLPLHEALRTRGAEVQSVPVYRWQLPDDPQPLREAAAGLCEEAFDMLLITSAQQLRHLLEVADRDSRRDAVLAALQRVPIMSIGPTATEMLAEYDLRPRLEPSHPKMGHLVRESLAWWNDRT